MNKNLKLALTSLSIIIIIFLAYRLLIIRKVNYEIGGIIIPSEYNFLTGKAKPILNYHGKAIKKTVEDRTVGKIGLTEEETIVAQLRWAVFEKWVNSHPKYKGWQDNPEIFKRAHDAFRKELEARGTRIRVVK